MTPRLSLVILFALASLFAAAQASTDAAPGSATKIAAPSTAVVSNDPRVRGEHVFADSGCQQCHTIRHNGGKKGPDLSGVGRRLNETQIRTQILNGGKQMPSFADVLHSLRDKEKKK